MAIDFFSWDLVEDFTIFDAACLWHELDPSRVDTNNIPSNVEALMGVIERALGGYRGDKIAGNKLRVNINPKYSRSYTDLEPIPVKREDLRKWAKSKDQYPAFLFPEVREKSTGDIEELSTPDRPDTLEETKKLDLREKTKLLLIIKALLAEVGRDPTDRGLATDIVKRLTRLGFTKDSGLLRSQAAIKTTLQEVDQLNPEDL